MIDTIRVKCHARPTDNDLLWYWRKRESTTIKTATTTEYFFHPTPDSGIPFHGSYRPTSRDGDDLLLLEMSLPKVMYGNNWTMLTDIEAAIKAADEGLQATQGIPELPCSIAHMPVSRFDPCYNHQVGSLVPHCVKALAELVVRFVYNISIG